MYTLPPGYAALIQGPHTIRSYAWVFKRPWPTPKSFANGSAWLGSEMLNISPLPVESGSLTIDNSGVQRRRATLTIAPSAWAGAAVSPLPTSVLSELTPFQTLVLLRYAVSPVGTPVSAPNVGAPLAFLLGIFVLTDVTPQIAKGGDIKLTLDLQDMSQDVSRRVLLKPYVTQNGQPMTQAIGDIIQNAYTSGGIPLPSYIPDPTTALTSGGQGPDTLYAAGYTWDEGQDPWEAAQQMVEAIGYQLYFNPTGNLLAGPIPNPAATTPCWTYTTGFTKDVNPMITSIKRPFSQSQVFNYVEYVVEGANANPSPDLLYTGTTFLAQIGDTDPGSPTNIHGPYGIAGDVQYDQINYQPSTALVAAKARLRRDLGAADMVTFSALPNPAHEAYDVIHVEALEIGLNQDYVIDTIDLPLAAGQDMTVTARRVVNVP